jgi:hypothetical protein
MSKKLIAVAAAAALALTGLAAIPANSAVGAFALSTITGKLSSSGDGTTADTAYTVKVPHADELLVDGASGTTSTAIRIDTTAPSANAVLSITATGGVKLLNSTQYAASSTTSATGTSTLSLTSIDGNATFYVYSTSTTAGTVLVSSSTGDSKTIYVEGVAGPSYNVAFTAPASVGISGTAKIIGTVTDVFGNKIESLVKGDFKVSVVGGSAAAVSNTVWRSTTKDYSIEVTGRSDAGPVAVSVELNAVPDEIDALGAPKNTFFATMNVTDLETANAALTAQVTALQAQLANSRPIATSVTKKKYNTLARKWNRAFPSQKVALKK